MVTSFQRSGFARHRGDQAGYLVDSRRLARAVGSDHRCTPAAPPSNVNIVGHTSPPKSFRKLLRASRLATAEPPRQLRDISTISSRRLRSRAARRPLHAAVFRRSLGVLRLMASSSLPHPLSLLAQPSLSCPGFTIARRSALIALPHS